MYDRPPTNQPCRFFGARPLVRIDTRSGLCCGVLLRSKVCLLLLGPVSSVFESRCVLRVALRSPVRAAPLSRGAAFRRAALIRSCFALERRMFPRICTEHALLYIIWTICEARREVGFRRGVGEPFESE